VIKDLSELGDDGNKLEDYLVAAPPSYKLKRCDGRSFRSREKMTARIGYLAQLRELTLTLSGGKSLALPILGGAACAADAFEFSRFLNRVRSDLEERS
jgi:hypothetical protein